MITEAATCIQCSLEVFGQSDSSDINHEYAVNAQAVIVNLSRATSISSGPCQNYSPVSNIVPQFRGINKQIQ